MLISLSQFIAATKCGDANASVWYEPLWAAMQEFEIANSVQRAASFLANTSHESAFFNRTIENLNYSANGLAATWPNRFAVDPGAQVKQPNLLAQSLAHKPDSIANAVYSNRYGNGDPASFDGWNYRGRGPIQITFKSNYQACGEALGMDLVGHPEMLLLPAYAARAAGWYWSSHKCNQLMDAGDFVGCVKAINGGLIGLDSRRDLYQGALVILATD